jgi:hypothetical protein
MFIPIAAIILFNKIFNKDYIKEVKKLFDQYEFKNKN